MRGQWKIQKFKASLCSDFYLKAFKLYKDIIIVVQNITAFNMLRSTW